jgi:hypothetical protein
MNAQFVQGHILDQGVDVIVNTWNRNVIPWWLLLPQGVSGAIKRRGGTGPFKELAIRGMGFKTAGESATKLGIDRNSPIGHGLPSGSCLENLPATATLARRAFVRADSLCTCVST